MRLIVTLIDVYSFVLLIAVILSWVPVDRRHPLVAMLHGVTEPVLAPIRRGAPTDGWTGSVPDGAADCAAVPEASLVRRLGRQPASPEGAVVTVRDTQRPGWRWRASRAHAVPPSPRQRLVLPPSRSVLVGCAVSPTSRFSPQFIPPTRTLSTGRGQRRWVVRRTTSSTASSSAVR